MDEIIDREVSSKFLDDAYKCKPDNLGFLLQKIEYEIQNRDHAGQHSSKGQNSSDQ